MPNQNFLYTFNYDYHLDGSCIYENSICKFSCEYPQWNEDIDDYDEAFVNIELDRNFKVDDNQTTELIIPIELKNLFVNNGDIYDIESNPKIHSLSQQAQILELANNLNTCF